MPSQNPPVKNPQLDESELQPHFLAAISARSFVSSS